MGPRARRHVVVVAVTLSLLAPIASASASTRVTGPAAHGCPPARPGVLSAAPSVAGTARTVALTFDDGPGASTHAILSVLRRYHVRATFFNLGQAVRRHPTLVREEANDGFLLGDHTNSHPDLRRLSRGAQVAEVDQTAARQRQLTGVASCVFRPPYGSFTLTTRQVVASRGMSLWLWNDGSGDWMAQGSGATSWVRRIERAVIGGSAHQRHAVVLLHNQRRAMPATVRALATIIRSFRSRGYAFVDLLGRTGPPGACGRPATPVVDATTIPGPWTLAAGESATSPGGQYVLAMSSGGDLTWSLNGGRVLLRVPGSPGSRVVLSDGTLRVVDAAGQVTWRAGVAGDATLRLGADGRLALVSGGRVDWSGSGTISTLRAGDELRPGWRLWSADRRCVLAMNGLGALTLRTADGQVFWTNGVRSSGARTVLQRDGNLVTVSTAGRQVWSSATSRHAGAVLTVTDAGRVLMTNARGDHLWATP